MSAVKPTRIANPEVLRQVDPANFRAFAQPFVDHFDRHGISLPPIDRNADYDYERLASFLLNTSNNHPPELIDALFYVNPLCDDEAQDELTQELEDAGFEPPADMKMSAADWTLFAWRVAPEIVVRLFPRYSQRAGRSVQCFRARGDILPPIALDKLSDLDADCKRWFTKKRRGENTSLRHFPEKDGSHSFIVRHGTTFARVGLMEADRPAASGHPETYDLIQVHTNPPCLLVVAKGQTIQRYYRSVFGEHLFGDVNAFAGDATYTLDPLRESAVHVSENCLVPGLLAVSVTELSYNFGGINEERTVYRAKNLAYRYDDDGRPQERKLPRSAPGFAKLALRLQGVEGLVYLDIKPPCTARPSRLCDGDIIDAFLLKAGIKNGIPENAPSSELVVAP